MATTERSIANFRAQALLALLTRHPLTRQRTEAVLSQHPNIRAMKRATQDDVPLLEEVMWRELEEVERAALSAVAAPSYGTRAAWDYYQRRRRAARLARWAHATRLLGAPWAGLMGQDAPGAKRKCTAIGLEMLAACVSRTQDAGDWLAKLGTTGAIQVLRRSRAMGKLPVSEQTAHCWRAAYVEISSTRRETDIASVLGRMLLAAMFAKLPESSRTLAIASAASNIFDVLGREMPLDPAGSEEWGSVEALVSQALREDDASDPMRRSEGKA